MEDKMADKYEIKETGPVNKPFQVFYKSNDGAWPLSEHHNKLEATKAIKRYEEGDKRRAKRLIK